MDETQTERLAAAMHALRPDWPLTSLHTFIADKLAPIYAYRDAAIALTYVATDVDSTPSRVLEGGPWWDATRHVIVELTPTPPRYDSQAHGRARAARVPSEDATTQLAAARQAIRPRAEVST